MQHFPQFFTLTICSLDVYEFMPGGDFVCPVTNKIDQISRDVVGVFFFSVNRLIDSASLAMLNAKSIYFDGCNSTAAHFRSLNRNYWSGKNLAPTADNLQGKNAKSSIKAVDDRSTRKIGDVQVTTINGCYWIAFFLGTSEIPFILCSKKKKRYRIEKNSNHGFFLYNLQSGCYKNSSVSKHRYIVITFLFDACFFFCHWHGKEFV